MKKINRLVIAFLLLLSAAALSAQNEVKTFKVGDLYYTTFQWQKGVEIVKPTDGTEYNLAEITIPDTVSDGTTRHGVLGVGENVFKDNLTVKKINFPETTVYLQNGSFQNSGLTSLTLPANVNDWGGLKDLNQLEVVEYGEGITSSGRVSGAKIHTVKLPSTLTTMSGYTDMPALAVIELPVNDPYRITFKPYDNSFRNTPVEQVTVKVPAVAVEDYKTHWAWSSVGFKAIDALPGDFPAPVKEPEALGKTFRVGDLWYKVTDAEKQEVAVDRDGMSSGGGGNYPALDIVEVPGSITYNTFTYTVTAVGGSAFSSAKALQQVFLPESVTKIDRDAFSHSPLTYIEMPAVTEIGNNAFFVCEQLTSVTLPASLTAIGTQAFQRSGLTEITVPASVTSFTFSRAALLSKVVLEEGITEVPRNAFLDCEALTSVTLPSTVTAIGRAAFRNTALTSVTLPASVDSIADYAFFLTPLESIEFPAGVKYIGHKAFEGGRFTSVTLPEGIKTIGAGAFTTGDASSGSGVMEPIMKDIYLPVADPAQITAGYIVLGWNFDKKLVTVHVPVGSEEAYQAAEIWQDYTIVGDIESSVNEVLAHGIEARGAQGMLHITPGGTEAVSVSVYSTTGSLIKNITLSGNTCSLPLSAGVYIVRAGSGAKRVVVY